MLSYRVENNLLELPETVATQFSDTAAFETTTDGETIVLRRAHAVPISGDDVRAHFDRLGITDVDIENALSDVRTARSRTSLPALEAIQAKLERAGITEQDIHDAVVWARRSE